MLGAQGLIDAVHPYLTAVGWLFHRSICFANPCPRALRCSSIFYAQKKSLRAPYEHEFSLEGIRTRIIHFEQNSREEIPLSYATILHRGAPDIELKKKQQ